MIEDPRRDERSGLLGAHIELVDYFDELYREHDATPRWRVIKRWSILHQTRALRRLGERLVQRKRRLYG